MHRTRHQPVNPHTAAIFVCLAILTSGPLFAQEVTTLANVRANGDITVAENGDVYVADFGAPNLSNGTTVVRITPDGQSNVFANGLPNAPSGVDFDSVGNLIVASFAGGVLNSIAPDGTVSPLANSAGPVGVVVDDADQIFVAGCSRNAVLQLSPTGFLTVFSTSALFACPNGITIGHDGALYIVNFNNPIVVRVGLDGVASTFATTPGTGNGHIEYFDGMYYLTGRTTNMIYGVSTDGTVSAVAGTGVDGNDDGPALEATISRPNGIGISPDGRFLYVSGSSDFTATTIAIRQIDLQPQGTAFIANRGLSGAWASPSTLGQGFVLDLFGTGEDAQIFVAWFTYDTNAPPADELDGFGSNQHRWFTAQGTYEGDTATLEIFLTSGGIFGDPTTPTTISVGTMTIRFISCTEAVLTFDLSSYDQMGEIEISRITPAGLCESLVAQQ